MKSFPFSTNLFWDINPKDLDEDSHRDFIVERILARGDIDDYLWAKNRYGLKTMETVFQHAKTLNVKSISFWSNFFHISQDTLCTQESSHRKQSAFWKRSAKTI